MVSRATAAARPFSRQDTPRFGCHDGREGRGLDPDRSTPQADPGSPRRLAVGPRAGIKIVELTGIGPGPMCAMLLADLGATVLRIDRPGGSDLGVPRPLRYDLLLRGRRCLALDLKRPDGKALDLRLVEVVDAAMVDGTASLMTSFHGMMAAGLGSHERGTNILDTGSHFYEVYECADGRWISVAAIEGKFYAELLRRLDLDPATMPPQRDREHWPEAKAKLAALFKTRTQDEWCALLEGTDA